MVQHRESLGLLPTVPRIDSGPRQDPIVGPSRVVVLVVCVGKVCMVVTQRRMAVPVCVRNGGRFRQVGGKRIVVRMLVMQVVFVQVLMLHNFVRVAVFVTLAQVQPDADGHQCPGHHQRRRHWLAQTQHRHQRTEER